HVQGRHAGLPGRSRDGETSTARAAIRRREHPLSLARSPDVANVLWRFRPPRPRPGMVELGRRHRWSDGRGMRTVDRIPAQLRHRHRRVADPDVSAWVEPNAGSGKTHVLAQRVINLLLLGVQPEKILCITFTKAAAANMAKRVFDTLAEWNPPQDGAL